MGTPDIYTSRANDPKLFEVFQMNGQKGEEKAREEKKNEISCPYGSEPDLLVVWDLEASSALGLGPNLGTARRGTIVITNTLQFVLQASRNPLLTAFRR